MSRYKKLTGHKQYAANNSHQPSIETALVAIIITFKGDPANLNISATQLLKGR